MVDAAELPVAAAGDAATSDAQFVRQDLADAAHRTRFAGQVNPIVFATRQAPFAQGGFQCAAGLIFGHATENEYADDIVNRPDMMALRRKVVATVDDSIDEASADVTAVLKDCHRVHVFVEHAIGSLQNPMTDVMLEVKFRGLSDSVLGAQRTTDLITAAWGLGQAADVSALVALARPCAARGLKSRQN